ncbi:MAG TPA: PIG-L family deacetylase [Pseudonocardia sp.]
MADLSESARPELCALPRLRLGFCQTVVVVGTHLDEELCAVGGLLASLAAARKDVRVLAVTDGDAATDGPRYDGPAHSRDGAANGSDDGAWNARRARALAAAYQHLGLDPGIRYRLALGSGQVRRAEHDVLAALSEVLGYVDRCGLVCVAPWPGDSDPDHAAVGRAAMVAARAYHARMLHYSITAWGDGAPPVLPEGRARRFSLPGALGLRKYQALRYLHRRSHPHPAPPEARDTGGDTGGDTAGGGELHACEVFLTTAEQGAHPVEPHHFGGQGRHA